MPCATFIHSFIAWCCAESTGQPQLWVPGGNSVASVRMQSVWTSNAAVTPCSRLLQRLWRALEPSGSNPGRVLFSLNFCGSSLVQFRISSYLKAPKQEPNNKYRMCTELFPSCCPRDLQCCFLCCGNKSCWTPFSSWWKKPILYSHNSFLYNFTDSQLVSSFLANYSAG